MTKQTTALASFEWQNEPIGADQFNDKLSFTGTGSQKASDTEKQAINDVFAGLAAELISPSLGDGSSGVVGTVLIGPTCPGPVQLNNPQCADQPYPAKVSVLTPRGQAGAQALCDANGQFKISLAPGEYTLRFSSPDGSALPHSVEQTVTVSAGQFTEVNITLDSGMR